MDKLKEIEKIEFIIGSTIRECEQKDCIRNCEFARRKDCKYCRAAKDLVNSGYGDTKAAAKEAVADRTEEIFSWLYNNLVNANFVTGNAEISMVDLQNKAAEYGIDFFNNKGKLTVKEADND